MALYPTSRVELRLTERKSFKFIIELPFDLSQKEANRVKAYLDTMVGEPKEKSAGPYKIGKGRGSSPQLRAGR